MNLVYGKSLKFSKQINFDEMKEIEACFTENKIISILFDGHAEIDQSEELISYNNNHKNIKTFAVVGTKFVLNAVIELRGECAELDMHLSLCFDNVNRNKIVNNFMNI